MDLQSSQLIECQANSNIDFDGAVIDGQGVSAGQGDASCGLTMEREALFAKSPVG